MGNAEAEILTVFGERLRTVRLRSGVSQEGLAGIADLDRTYISLLERGRRNPSFVCVAKLASALGVTVSELCDFEEEKSHG